MPSVQQICFLSACSNALLQPKTSSVKLNTALVGASRRPTTNWRYRHHPYQHCRRFRRNNSAAVLDKHQHQPPSLVYCSIFRNTTTTTHTLTGDDSTAVETGQQHDPIITIEQMDTPRSSLGEAPILPPRAGQRNNGREKQNHPSETESSRASEEVPTPPMLLPTDDVNETRSLRSESSVSRNSNRLSLTLPLPIALPNPLPTRPMPASAATTSYPPTPSDTPSFAQMSPVNPDDLITAIAAHERRILDLREELEREEAYLSQLKRQWANNEARKGRPKPRNAEPLRPAPHIDTPDEPRSQRSLEMDRRKALLLAQGTPTQNRRRVFTGSHTRALSLLSPVKTTGDGFAVHEDGPAPERGLRRTESVRSATKEPESPSLSGYAPFVPGPLAKRASWAPRSAYQQTGTGVKQIAEDFKAGLWTFMEDLRQATVGEEPITGQGTYLRGIDGNMRSAMSASSDANQDNIGATTTPKPNRTSVDEDGTPTQFPRYTDEDDVSDKEKENIDRPSLPARHKSLSSKTAKHAKRFSLTPLSMDAFDDDSWSSWETPAKSPRWSGSTVNGDLITLPDDSTPRSFTSPKKTSSGSRHQHTPSGPSTPSANKLAELLPPVLNNLTPSNLKKTATDFMKEWEKSLSPPPQPAEKSSYMPQQSRAD